MNINYQRDRQGIFSLVLGMLGMGLWFIPMISIFVNFFCLYLGSIGLETRYRDLALSGIVLGCIGFILTCLRSGLVYFLA